MKNLEGMSGNSSLEQTKPDAPLPFKKDLFLSEQIGDSPSRKGPVTATLKTPGGDRATKKRESIYTNISNIVPPSPYRNGEAGSRRASALAAKRTSIPNSAALREQIYYDWLQKKMMSTKAEAAAQKEKEREMNEHAQLESKDKTVMVG